MKVTQEYLEKNNQMIIIISGLTGTKRSVIAKHMRDDMEKDMEIVCVNLDDFCREKNEIPIVDFFDNKIRDWDNPDSYDWDKFNGFILENKDKGIIIYGDMFPKSKLNFTPDFHVHIKISKEKLIEKKKEYIEKNSELCEDMMVILDKLALFINKFTYTHYINSRNESKIDIWLDANANNPDEMYEQAVDFIINAMIKFLNAFYAQNPQKEKKYVDNSKYNSNFNSSSNSSSSSSSDEKKYIDVEPELKKEYKEYGKYLGSIY